MEERPRHHFARIKALPRTEWKDAILNTVPEHYQDWVRTYLKIYLERARHEQKQVLGKGRR
jgi:hypothetical protein